jgi:hypothetical protein
VIKERKEERKEGMHTRRVSASVRRGSEGEIHHAEVQYSIAYSSWSLSIPPRQVADPSGDVVPVGQIKHDDDPMVFAYVPAAQGVHFACFQFHA